MKIGIDIDDTTLLTRTQMIKYANIFHKEYFGIESPKIDAGNITSRKYLQSIYGWDEQTETVFFNKYYKKVLEECTLLPNADKVIKRLKQENNTIHFITARLMNVENCDAKKITEESLTKYKIPYDSIDLGQSNKIEFCKIKGIDIHIDDCYDICKELMENNILVILMLNEMNENIKDSYIPKAKNWDEVYEILPKIRKH